MQDGATRDVFGKTFRVQIQTHFDGAAGDLGHVVVGDVAVGAIRHTNAERFEGFGVQQFPNLSGRNHGRKLGRPRPSFNVETTG